MTKEEAIKIVQSATVWTDEEREALSMLIPELAENEDERIRKLLVEKISNLACGCFISQEQKQKFIHYLEKQKEQKQMYALTKEENILPKDIERDATQFCFDKGINITPHQAWLIASHYQVMGFNAGMDEAHIQAKEVIKHPEKYGLQKEKKETVNIDHFKSFMLQYLQEAANRKDDSEIEADTDKWAHKLLSLVDAEAVNQVCLDEDTELGLDRALQVVKSAKGNLCGYQSDDGIYECDHAIGVLENILNNGMAQNATGGAKGKVVTEEDFKALRNWLVEHGYYVGNHKVAEALRKLADMWDD